MLTFTDRKRGITHPTMPRTIEYYIAELNTASTYYSFGSPMPGRSFTATGNGAYRYGFNGQEKDNEVYGAGNLNTAEFWEYDTRLGRRWNVDPVVKPWESGYAVMGNCPIALCDPLGLDGEVCHDENGNAKWEGDVSCHGGESHKGSYTATELSNYGYNADLKAVVVKPDLSCEIEAGVNKADSAIYEASSNASEVISYIPSKVIGRIDKWMQKDKEFVCETKATTSIGIQAGLGLNINGVDLSAEAGIMTFDLYEGKIDITKLKGQGYEMQNRVHQFGQIKGKILSEKAQIGLKGDISTGYYDGYNGILFLENSTQLDGKFLFGPGNYGPKLKLVDAGFVKVLPQMSTVSIMENKLNQSNIDENFLGIEIGATVRVILGLELKLKIGYK
jgi:hypothetical protein